jgi:hypothetical protein
MKPPKSAIEHEISRRSLLVSGLAIGLAALQAKNSLAASRSERRKHPEVYLLRGLANVFSLGLDEIGRRLNTAGIDAHVQAFTAGGWAFNKIVGDRAEHGAQPIALIGHSLGANAIVDLAEALDKKNIQVDYMASFAATNADQLPGNIKYIQNFYFARNGWGQRLVPGPKFRGKIENRDFSQQQDVSHFNIEKQRALQEEVVRNVLRIAR